MNQQSNRIIDLWSFTNDNPDVSGYKEHLKQQNADMQKPALRESVMATLFFVLGYLQFMRILHL